MREYTICTLNITRPTEKLSEPITTRRRKVIHTTTESVKNEFLGLLLIVLGIISTKLTGDGTAAVMMLMIGLSAIGK